jgi:hypothetical protein
LWALSFVELGVCLTNMTKRDENLEPTIAQSTPELAAQDILALVRKILLAKD